MDLEILENGLDFRPLAVFYFKPKPECIRKEFREAQIMPIFVFPLCDINALWQFQNCNYFLICDGADDVLTA